MTQDIKKRGLGRGLDALFQQARSEEEAFQPRLRRAEELSDPVAPQAGAQQSAAPEGAAPRRLPVDRLTPGKFQPRRLFGEEALEQLAASIAAHGVLQPLLVRPVGGDRYEIIAGERRWRAAQKARVHDLPVVIRALTDEQALEIGLIENLQREDLNALEEAEGFQRLIDAFGHTQDMIAVRLGKSRSHVANTLRLLKLPAPVRALLQSGALSAGHARVLVGAENAAQIAGVIVRRGLSVRQAEKLMRRGAAPAAKKKGFAQKDVDTLALEEKMSSLLGLKVSIAVAAGGAGLLAVEYKSLDQLDDLLARLSRVPGKV